MPSRHRRADSRTSPTSACVLTASGFEDWIVVGEQPGEHHEITHFARLRQLARAVSSDELSSRHSAAFASAAFETGEDLLASQMNFGPSRIAKLDGVRQAHEAQSAVC